MGSVYNAGLRMVADNIFTAQELGQLLGETLTRNGGELFKANVDDIRRLVREYGTPAAQSAMWRIVGDDRAFNKNLASTIFGLDQAGGDALEQHGVMTAAELLTKAGSKEGRRELATNTGINNLALTSFVERADVARVVGIGSKYAAILNRIGVNNIRELGRQNARQLHTRIKAFIRDDDSITNRRPSLDKVKNWVKSARLLPDAVFYVGNSGTNFTKAGFEELTSYQQGLLILGSDVQGPAGGVFDASTMVRRAARRRPREISEFIRNAEQGNYFGNDTDVSLSGVQRVKVGRDTVGYELTFDVTSDEQEEYEGMMLDAPEGTITVAVNKDGHELTRFDDLWPGGYHEG